MTTPTETTQDAALARSNGAAPAPRKPSLLAKYAADHGLDGNMMLEVLAKTIFPNAAQATREHVHALLLVADQYKLNPFTRELFALPKKGGGIIPVVSIDGWLQLANSHPQFDGLEVAVHDNPAGGISHATCRIYRKDRAHPIEVTEYFEECVRPTDPWKTAPRRMLRHKAIIQCARVAFSFSGIHDIDEAARFAADAPEEHKEGPSPQLQRMRAKIQEADEGPREADAEVVEDEEYSQEPAGAMFEDDGPGYDPADTDA